MSAPARDRLAMPTGAVEVLPPEAPREDWLAERRKSIGGSDASLLAGVSHYGSRMELWLDKTGRSPEKRQTDAMEWGTLLEPVAVQWLARNYDLHVVPAGLLRRPDRPRMHANPDGIELNALGVPVGGIEAKTTNHRMAWEWTDEQTPDHAELQAQWCMYVTGLGHWWIIGLIDGRNPQVRRIVADPALQSMLSDLADQFWTEHVETDEAPALDGSAATISAVKAWLSVPEDGRAVELDDELAAAFEANETAKARVRLAKSEESETEARLRVALGAAEQVVDDLALEPDERTVLATAVCNGTFAEKRFREAEPELAEEYTTEQPALDVDALRHDHPDIYGRHRARVIRPRKALREAIARRAVPTPRSS